MVVAGTGLAWLEYDRSLIRGASGYAGEIGHITVEMDVVQCFCGSRGCVKAYRPATISLPRSRVAWRGALCHLDRANGWRSNAHLSHVCLPPASEAMPWRNVVAKAAQALGGRVAASSPLQPGDDHRSGG